jgi:hypothetical protein
LVPVVFHVRSGDYPDPVTLLPYRFAYLIHCETGGVNHTGAITWQVDHAHRFGASTTTYPWALYVGGSEHSWFGAITVERTLGAEGATSVGLKQLDVRNCTLFGAITQTASGDATRPVGDLRVDLDGAISATAVMGLYSHDESAVVRNVAKLSTHNTIFTATIHGSVQIRDCVASTFGDIGGAPNGGTNVVDGDPDYLGFRDCQFEGTLWAGTGYPGTTIPDTNYLRFDASSYAAAATAGLSFHDFDPPAGPDLPSGYVLTDRAAGVGVDTALLTGHVLPEDYDVQQVAARLDGLAGSADDPLALTEVYLDPVAGSDDNDGLTSLTAVATGTMALRRIGRRPLRHATRVWLLSSGTDVLPRTIPIELEANGSFSMAGVGAPTALYTGATTVHAPVGPVGYVATRVTFAGAPGWADDVWVGSWFRPGAGAKRDGEAIQIARSGTDWVEVLQPYDVGDSWVAADSQIIRPSVVLTQSYAVEVVATIRGGDRQARYAGPVLNSTAERARVQIANLTVDFDAPGGVPMLDRAAAWGVRVVGDAAKMVHEFVAIRGDNLQGASGFAVAEFVNVLGNDSAVWDNGGRATVATLANLYAKDRAGLVVRTGLGGRAGTGVSLVNSRMRNLTTLAAINGSGGDVGVVTGAAEAFYFTNCVLQGVEVLLSVNDNVSDALTLSGTTVVGYVGTFTMGVGAAVSRAMRLGYNNSPVQLHLHGDFETAAVFPAEVGQFSRISLGNSADLTALTPVAGAYTYTAPDPDLTVAAWPTVAGTGTADGLGAFVTRI